MKTFLKKSCATLAVFLLSLAMLSAGAKADTATQCSIDHAVSGAVEFQQCPVSTANDDILSAGFDGVRLDPNSGTTKTPIWAHDVCHYVDNASASALFIPLQSAQEWSAFVANPPAQISFANCCLPRALRVGDAPKPQEACASGWQLKGIVDDKRKLVATPVSDSQDSGFALVAGQKEDATYPIVTLPVNRDDIGAVLPDANNPAKVYTAFYSCGTTADAYIEFHMQCKNAQWFGDDVTPAPAATTETETPTPTADTSTAAMNSNRTTADVKTADVTTQDVSTSADCQLSTMRTYSKSCTDGSAGSTTYRQVFNSCTKTIQNVITANTCANVSGGISGGITGGTGGSTGSCTASSVIGSQSCPTGQIGTISVLKQHVCDGSNNGAGSDNTLVLTNTCSGSGVINGGGTGGGTVTFTCTPTDVLTTTPCPDPNAGGIITLRRVRVCDGSNNGAGTQTETVFQNNCVASGCINSTILKTSAVCNGGTIVTAKVFNSCTKQITNEVISNTCK